MKLEMKNICKSFGEKRVLNNVSLTAEGGKSLWSALAETVQAKQHPYEFL